MSDGQALMRSVLAAPADDAPRLIYADWLDEQGRAEDAEFIRVQIELARLGFDGAFHVDSQGRLQRVSEEVQHLQERQMFLWMGGHGRPTLPPDLANWPMTIHPMRGQMLRLRRGFVERIGCFTEVFLDIAADLFRHQPVMHVSLVDRQPVQSIEVYHWVRAEERDTIASIPATLWAFLHPSEPDSAVYLSADDAEAALSEACIRYGRHQAGLGDAPGVGRGPTADG